MNACCIFRRLKKPRSPPALGPELQSLLSRANFVNALAIGCGWVGGWVGVDRGVEGLGRYCTRECDCLTHGYSEVQVVKLFGRVG